MAEEPPYVVFDTTLVIINAVFVIPFQFSFITSYRFVTFKSVAGIYTNIGSM